jgi:acylphosphatase
MVTCQDHIAFAAQDARLRRNVEVLVMANDMTVQVSITGRVQGVSFRAWAQAEARRLGLTGWVRNERDGSVSALLSGPDDAVGTMIARLREGPPAARVADVVVVEAAAQESPPDFAITG